MVNKIGIILILKITLNDVVNLICAREKQVGHPHVVNPDARLQRLAEKRGWPIINWGLEPSLASAVAA